MNKEGASAAAGGKTSCLEIAMDREDSKLKASDGREIPFARAILTIHNACDQEALDVLPRVTLGQEGGTVQDVTGSLSIAASAIAPGKSITWDVFDVLLPAHPGTASKVHMFGYRAALNWKFDLSVRAEYRTSASPEPVSTPVSRWMLQWSVADPPTGAVGLAIEEIRE